MSDITLRAELIQRGFGTAEIARLVRAGELARLRRGAYGDPLAADTAPAAAHRALVLATVRQVSDEAVVSHGSAAVLHGLPTWSDQLERVHLTRDRAGGGKIKHNLHQHGLPLNDCDAVMIEGIRVTSLPRTILDLSCSQPLEHSVAAGDAALRLGLRQPELLTLVEAAGGRHGVGQARRAAELIHVGSESPGESVSRVRFWRWGLPTPTLQYVVRDPHGGFVARGDFGWPELGTIGEFDGKSKYGPELLKPGQTVREAVLAEKRREERMRELGWQVVRWSWADLSKRDELVARLEAAFRRGRDLSA
jgi:hypothetical protein